MIEMAGVTEWEAREMAKEFEKRRAEAENRVDLYTAVIDSIEPDITGIDQAAFYASAAISLKRIADAAELFAVSLLKDGKQKEDEMRDWATRHGFGDLWDKHS